VRIYRNKTAAYLDPRAKEGTTMSKFRTGTVFPAVVVAALAATVVVVFGVLIEAVNGMQSYL